MWQDEMVRILRHMVNDLGTGTPVGEPPIFTYSDDRMQELIMVSAQFVQQEITFQQKYTIDVSNLILSPDPTQTAPGVNNRDDSFINLVLIKSACFIDNAEARYAAGRAVLMMDAGKQIDLRNVGQTKLAIWQKGWCQNYKDAKFEYMAGNTGAAGMGIIGPFRESWNAGGAYGPGYGWSPDGDSGYVGYKGNYGLGGDYGRFR